MTARDLFPKAGVHGFADYRFHLAAALCLFSATLFYESGEGGGLASLPLPLLIAFLLVSTPAWKLRTLGSAESPAGLVLHGLLATALASGLRACFCLGPALAVAAIPPAGAYAGYPAWSVRPALWMAETAGEAVGLVFAPGIFSRFAVVAVAALALVSVIAGRRAARAATAAALALAAVAYLGRADVAGALYFAGGGAALAAAYALLREDAAYRDFWLLSLRRMEAGGRAPRVHNTLKLEILGELFGGRRAEPEALRLMAARRLRCEPEDERLDGTLAALLRELIERERLLALRRTGWGESVGLDRRTYDNGLLPARWKCAAQSAAVIVLLLGYLLSPADFLADAIPVSGLLDDAAMLLLGGAALWRTWRGGFAAWYAE